MIRAVMAGIETPRDDDVVPNDRFRVLCVDGGGIRGLIPALVLADVERRLQEGAGPDARLADYFHMFAGTSTGGLVALSLTVPDLPSRPDRPLLTAANLADVYTIDGPKVFHRSLLQKLRTLWGWLGPKYSPDALEQTVTDRLGTAAKLADALRELIVLAYDMTDREPYLFKRWRAREEEAQNRSLVDAALSTSAAPTYFPSHEVEGHALVDGGVFAANPTIAAVVEALKRRSDERPDLTPDDLLVVSIGTGLHETHYSQAEVSGWGKLGWILPQEGEPPILATVLGGSSDGVDHWAETLLNKPRASDLPTEELGRGPRFFRLQVPLDPPIALDDASPAAVAALESAAARLISEHENELAEITARLLRAGPIPPDPRA
jgi:patatin-like phospholipase/acyl hydrolase